MAEESDLYAVLGISANVPELGHDKEFISREHLILTANKNSAK